MPVEGLLRILGVGEVPVAPAAVVGRFVVERRYTEREGLKAASLGLCCFLSKM